MYYCITLQYHKILGFGVGLVNNIPLENLIPDECSTGIKELMCGLIHGSGKLSL